MNIKRLFTGVLERAIDARIVRSWNIGPLFEEEHLRRFFRYFDVDCVFDVGANSGQYATMLRKYVGYKGIIISFEPIPEAAVILRKNAQRDRWWFVEELALGEAPGRANFNIMTAQQMSSLHQPQSAETDDLFKKDATITRRVEVQIATLESVLQKYRKILGFQRPFLKLDTQGHDVNVVLGAGETINEFVGLQSELAIRRIYAGTPTYEEALTLYRNKGFVLSAFVPNNSGFFPHLIEIDCIMFRERK